MAGISALSLTEQDHEGLREITFVSEHKTGHAFGISVMKCLVSLTDHQRAEFFPNDAVKTRMVDMFQNYTFSPHWGKIVYMVRNPYAMLVSNYFHTMACEKRKFCFQFESWVLRPADFVVGVEAALSLREKPLPNETYNAYLHRLNMADGLLAVMAGHARQVLLAMERNREYNGGDPRVLVVCLGDVFQAFDKTVQVILRHFGYSASREELRCLKLQDPSHNWISHSTRHVSKEVKREAMRIVEELDNNHFGGRFRDNAIASLCGPERLS